MLERLRKWARWIKNDYRKEVFEPFLEMKKWFREGPKRKDEEAVVFDMQPKPEKQKIVIGNVLTKTGIAHLLGLVAGNKEQFKKSVSVVVFTVGVLMILNALDGWKLIAVAHPIYFTDWIVPPSINMALSILALMLLGVWFVFGIMPTGKSIRERNPEGTMTDIFINVAAILGVLLGSACGKELTENIVSVVNPLYILSFGLAGGEMFITIAHKHPMMDAPTFFGLLRGPGGALLENATMNAVVAFIVLYTILRFAIKESHRTSMIASASLAITYCFAVGLYVGMANAMILLAVTIPVSIATIAILKITAVPLFATINRVAGKQIERTALTIAPGLLLFLSTILYILFIFFRLGHHGITVMLSVIWRILTPVFNAPCKIIDRIKKGLGK